MEQLNRIEIRGVVGSVKRQIVDEKEMARLAIATSRAYRDKGGNAIIETTWHNVVVWDCQKLFANKPVEKGTKISVVGRVRSQKFTGEDSVERTFFEVIANQVKIIDSEDSLQYEM